MISQTPSHVYVVTIWLTCSTGRVRSTTLLRPLFFTIFLFHATIVIEGEGIGARYVWFPHLFFVSARLAQENDVFELRAMCMLMCTPIPLAIQLNHRRSYIGGWENQRYPYTWPWVRIHHFLERVGQTHKRCGNRTDLAPIPSPSITIVARKRKTVNKKRTE